MRSKSGKIIEEKARNRVGETKNMNEKRTSDTWEGGGGRRRAM